MKSIRIKQGDLAPPIRAILSDANGPVDLSDVGVTVFFRMRPVRGGGPTIDRPAVKAVDTTGGVSYSWQAGDTDVANDYACAFVVMDGSTPSHYPNFGEISLSIEKARSG